MKHKDNLIWLDLEMTGLCTTNDFIIEIATVITDKSLNVLADGPVLALYQPESVLAKMDAWNQKQHNQSGLVTRVQQSNITPAQAEKQTLHFISQFVDKNTSPMCGNSICQDRRFLAKEMPELERFFHYRHIDVSTIKELAKRWKPSAMPVKNSASKHLALADIYDSIEELKHYRKHFING